MTPSRLLYRTDFEYSKLETIIEELDLNDIPSDGKHESEKDSKGKFLDTEATVVEFLECIHDISADMPSLFIDIEGINLSRHGSISILQINVHPADRTYLLDIHTLQEKAFLTPNSRGTTLKTVLESNEIKKVFFDVRNDSDALFAHYGIQLAGIHDLQLMELVTRPHNKKFVKSLAKCIERDAPITFAERVLWSYTKERGRRLFAPECGGSYEVFNARPLSEVILQYCCQDVEFLPRLWKTFDDRMTEKQRD